MNIQKIAGSDEYFKEDLRRFYTRQLIDLGVTVVILLVEALAYWKLRYKIVKKGFAWLHIAGFVLALIVLPLLYTVYTRSLDKENTTALEYSIKVNSIGDARLILAWTFLIVGHLFFVMVLIDARKKRREELVPIAPDSPDILNDYA